MSPRRRRSPSIAPPFTSPDQIPLVCFTRDIARFCRCSEAAIWRKIRARDFSLFPPPRGSNPYSWLKSDLIAYLNQPKLNLQPTGLRPLRRYAK